jgi:hypothetical protein
MQSLWPALGFAAVVFAVMWVVSASNVGCGGARAAFDGTTYRDGAVAFRLPPAPAGWRRIAVTDATLAFRDDAEDASILINARCGDRRADPPLEALRNHLIAGTTERVVSFEETIPFDAREAIHTHVVAKLDGVPMAYDIFVLKKDDCVYDFVRVFAPSRNASEAPSGARAADAGAATPGMLTFESFVKRFRTLPNGGPS